MKLKTIFNALSGKFDKITSELNSSEITDATHLNTPSVAVLRDALGGSEFSNLKILCTGTTVTNALSMEASDAVALGGFGLFLKAVSFAQTTSATPVPLFTGSLPPIPMVVGFSFTVIGKSADGTKRAVIKKDISIFSDGVNVSTDFIQDTFTFTTDPSYDVVITGTLLDLGISVIGDATDNMNWLATFEEGVNI